MVSKISDEALYRFSVISQILTLVASGMSRSKAIGQVALRPHFDTQGQRRSVTSRTLYRWLKDFDANGSTGLLAAKRAELAGSLVLSEQFIDFLKSETKEDEEASIPELIKRAEQYGIIKDRREVCRQTVYRVCRRIGIPVCRRKKSRNRDMRRFAYPNRMLMVLCDGKHFRAGAKRRKRLGYFFLDDATRRVLHAVCGTSENSELFMRGFYEMITKFGLPAAIYLDKGPGFIAKDCARVAAALNIPFLFGETRYPEGHGKVEKLNQTVLKALLRNLDNPEIDPSLGALELRLQHYFDVEYNNEPHGAFKGKASPVERFSADERPLEFPDSDKKLRQAFAIPVSRKVSADSVISFKGTLYEMPRGYGRQWVTIYNHLLERTIGFIHDGRMITLFPPDLEKNARLKRKKPKRTQKRLRLIKTAADLSFEKDFGPIVGADGGFADKE